MAEYGKQCAECNADIKGDRFWADDYEFCSKDCALKFIGNPKDYTCLHCDQTTYIVTDF
jgi:YHS domain-containing protein